MNKTVREKLEEIRPDINGKEFNHYYDKLQKDEGAKMYDDFGLGVGLDYILS